MKSKKRRRVAASPSIHPRNRYSSNPPDFALLASLYPSFSPFIFASRSGRPSIDFTDFNATRELTKVLLHHDHGVSWWIPDGQLCPTVPNRSNYIHWIDDLLSSHLVPARPSSDGKVRGFDIGTGANCIYPLLGASLLGWSFVGSDVTEVALEWARKNVESNPHLSGLIEIRDANASLPPCRDDAVLGSEVRGEDEEVAVNVEEGCHGRHVLVGVVRDDENFDFCMCNPPFFKSMDEAGLNPKTACGGTFEEMVCPGGELAFVNRIIEDSVVMKHSFRWFTSMVGRKANLKLLVSKLREVGVSIVKTTEFVQGQTARWGLAWSFVSPSKNAVALSTLKDTHHSFMLEGLQRQCGAYKVLKSAETFFLASGVSCNSDVSLFCLNISLSSELTDAIFKEDPDDCGRRVISPLSNRSNSVGRPCDALSFRVSVFEQMPGTVLVKGSSLNKGNPLSGVFSSFFGQMEESLKKEFLCNPHGAAAI